MEGSILTICIIILLSLLVLNTVVMTCMLGIIIIEWRKRSADQRNTIEANITISPIAVEDKRIVCGKQTDSETPSESGEQEIQKETENPRESMVKEKNTAKSNEAVQRSTVRSSTATLKKWHIENNAQIESIGYGAWIDRDWKKIGTGGGPQEIGDKITLKAGNGNICIIQCGEMFLGVPAKAQWKECDFRTGAYSECYCVPEGLESDCDYEITKIKECALLFMEKDTFRVKRKGSIEVKRL